MTAMSTVLKLEIRSLRFLAGNGRNDQLKNTLLITRTVLVTEVLEVVRDDMSGKKQIYQNYPNIRKGSSQRKTLIEEARTQCCRIDTTKLLKQQRSQSTQSSSSKVNFVLTSFGRSDSLLLLFGGSGQYRQNGDYSISVQKSKNCSVSRS